MPQNTNLNVSPYYDDFDKFKNFYKVLYRPGFPIQARELTTMQTIMQNQIESMGTHFFKDGAMVIPGQVGFDNNVDVILIQSSFLGSDVELYRNQLTGATITGSTTGVKAKVLYTIPASESDRGFISVYLKYTESGGTNKDILTFLNNEQLLSDKDITYGTTLLEIGTPFAQLIPTDAVGVASVGYVNQGVYFIRGYFVDVPSQYIILEQYSRNPTYRVGLEISESIITPEDDQGLNDNATGSSNYAAPGAHRFKIKATLIKKDINDDADKNFIELMRIKDGKVQSKVERSAYNEIEKELARRTYDTNGDFMITPFEISVRECLNDGFNNGVYAAGEITQDTKVKANENLFAIQVSPGKAYLKGYPITTTTPRYLDVPKPRTTEKQSNIIIPFELGNYVRVMPKFGLPEVTGSNVSSSYQIVTLTDSFNATPGATNGDTIGFARIASYEFENPGVNTIEGTSGGQVDDIYKVFLFDVSMITKLRLTASATITAGSLIVGKQSGARGFIRIDGGGTSVTSQTLSLLDIKGTFRANEIITVDGRDVGTIQRVFTYEFSDVRQMVGRGSTNVVSFNANLIYDDEVAIRGTKFTWDSTNLRISIFNGNIVEDIRPGDKLYFTNTTFFQVDALPSDLNLATVFNYSDQTVEGTLNDDTGSVPVIPNGTDLGALFRTRPAIRDQQFGDLFIELPKPTIKNVSDESFTIRKVFDSQLTSNSFTISLVESQQFSAVEFENYTLSVVAIGAGATNAIGDIIPLQTSNAAAKAYTTFNTTGVARTTITVSNLTGITAVRLIATISKNTVVQKVKNATKMAVWKVNKTTNQSDQIPFGLSYSPIYGTRIEDDDISLGVSDVYKLHAVYEANDDSEAVIPFITLVESAFFATGTLVVGRTSGAKALVVEFNTTNSRLSIVYQNESRFIQNEIVSGVNALNASITALVSDADDSINPGSKNVTKSFMLNPHQKNFMYDLSMITRNKNTVKPIRKLKIVADYFAHETTGDYFNINSYVGIDYKDIPVYTTPIDSLVPFKPQSDVLDFRPAVKKLALGTGSVADPLNLNCSTMDFPSRVFDSTSTIFDIPKPNSDFRCDIEYYIKRIDKLFVDMLGAFKVVLGKPAENPVPPENIDDAMLLSIIGHGAYGFNPDVDSRVFQEDIKRFTMRDITTLEKRVKNIEYYSVLTLLEQETNSLTIKDEFGFDKFKNGFLVDSFENQSVADLNNADYSASLDYNNRVMRASHYTTNVDLKISEELSSNIVRNTGIITLPYKPELIIEQPYASKTENVNPFNVFTFIGTLELNPSSDNWVDTETAPVQIQQVEGNFQQTLRDMNADQNGLAPAVWNSWQEDWSGAQTTVSGGEWVGWVGPLGRLIPAFGTRTTTTTGIVERRTGTQQRVVATFEQRSLGSRVINRRNVQFIRSRNIAIKAERLKPLTRFYGFFDNINITNYITPKIIELIKNPEEDARTNVNAFQANEIVLGWISSERNRTKETAGFSARIKAPNDGYKGNPYTDIDLPESYSAQTNFVNIDVDSLAAQVDDEFFGNIEVGMVLIGQTSGAIAIVKDRRLLTDRKGTFKGCFFIPRASVGTNPRWETGTRTLKLTVSATNETGLPGSSTNSNAQVTYQATGVIETLQETILSIRNASIVTEQLNEERTTSRTRQEQVEIGWWDPLAQSFLIQERGGMYLDSVEIYFATKDSNIPVSVQIREMQNGNPTNKILPFSTTTVYPDDVEISENASIPTRFTFPAPVYISETLEYCFVVFTDSNAYTCWISEMGEIDITGNRTISAQPYAGVLFKSQNASTWSPNQLQDLKFKIYRAKFSPLSGKLVVRNTGLGLGNGGILRLREDPIITYKPNQVLTLNNNTAIFSLGARIYQETTNASATVVSIDQVSNPNKLTLTDIDGAFLQGSTSGTVVTYPLISSQAIANMGVSTTAGVLTGNFGVGKFITGQTSGATAYVVSWNSTSGALQVNYVSKAFEAGETITQANPTVSSVMNTVAYIGDSIGVFPNASAVYSDVNRKITVKHSNHGMHDLSNNVRITGVKSEISPTFLTAALDLTATSVSVGDATVFHKKIGGYTVSDENPGFIKIDNEIMAYTAISSDGLTITLKTSGGRGSSGTTAATHQIDALVECYNLDGIPLTQINKDHTGLSNPTLDTYDLSTNFVASVGIVSGGTSATASQNVPFEVITPTVATVVQSETAIIARLNTVSGTSINDGHPNGIVPDPSFVNNNSFRDVTLNEVNYLDQQALILSNVNESAKLAGQKSLTMELLMTSTKDTLTPVVDLDRCSVITTSNRINNPVNFENATLAVGDPHESVYITRMISLDNQVSRSLKVMFDAYRPNDTQIRVLYRVVPVGFAGDENTLLYSFFNEDGRPDTDVSSVSDLIFKSYEYNKTGLEFKKFQIKIVLASSNQSYVPQVKYFRAIATAT